jgi:hypothetical protein
MTDRGIGACILAAVYLTTAAVLLIRLAVRR